MKRYEPKLKKSDNIFGFKAVITEVKDGDYVLYEDHLKAMEEQRNAYNELIMAVQTKHPDETSHETALRYIKQRENRCHGPVENKDKD